MAKKIRCCFLYKSSDGKIVSKGGPKMPSVGIPGTDGNYTVACSPSATLADANAAGVMLSGAHHAITCPKCMETPQFKSASEIPNSGEKNPFSELPDIEDEAVPASGTTPWVASGYPAEDEPTA